MTDPANRNNLALLNASAITEYALRPLGAGKSALERAEEYALTLPGVREVRYIVREEGNLGPDRKTVMLTDSTPSALFDLFPDSGYDDIFYFYADCPLLDGEAVSRIYPRHVKFLAHYSFADGYPYGVTPEIISTEIVPKLRGLAIDCIDPIDRETIFTVVQKDINAFDIETDLSPEDLRMLRLSLSADTLRNFTIVERIIEAGGSDERSIIDVIGKKPQLLRSLPAYISVQIVDGCPQSCSYCPYPVFGGNILEQRNEMSAGKFAGLMQKLKIFCDDAVVNVSLWGEPSLHTEIETIIESICSVPGFTALVETSGLGWRAGMLEKIAGKWGDKITWIISLDAVDRELYSRLRGDGYDEAHSAADTLIDISPGTTYVQAVRMKESEEYLESFYRTWKERTERVIIQKYDAYSGLLPERKVTDLSPVKRFPCWHVKRDLVVMMDGGVRICREDVQGDHTLGNAFTENLSVVWSRGEAWHERHIAEDYPDICKRCDEYYTYNY